MGAEFARDRLVGIGEGSGGGRPTAWATQVATDAEGWLRELSTGMVWQKGERVRSTQDGTRGWKEVVAWAQENGMALAEGGKGAEEAPPHRGDPPRRRRRHVAG